jgi:adenylate kinase
MRLVLLGPPGAGKGTQAQRLVQQLSVPHISTGDMLRQAIDKGTATGLEAKQYLDSGQLVPGQVMVDLVRQRLNQPDCAAGFLLDGFPRTVSQAEALDAYLSQRKSPLDAVLEMQVDEEELVHRLIARGRGDDQPDVIRQRMVAYRDQTMPVSAYYCQHGVLNTVDALGTPDQVFARLMAVVEPAKPRTQ